MPTPDRTSLDAIIAAGRDILRSDGLPGLTMQAVAQRVGVRAPSLYKRVRGRDDLLRLVVEASLHDLDVRVDDALASSGGGPRRRERRSRRARPHHAHLRPREPRRVSPDLRRRTGCRQASALERSSAAVCASRSGSSAPTTPCPRRAPSRRGRTGSSPWSSRARSASAATSTRRSSTGRVTSPQRSPAERRSAGCRSMTRTLHHHRGRKIRRDCLQKARVAEPACAGASCRRADRLTTCGAAPHRSRRARSSPRSSASRCSHAVG